MILQTNLKHIATADEHSEVINNNENVMVCCGRMGPMCIPVYSAMKELENDPKLKAALQNLSNLYALHTIEQHKGWYLEQGYMESGKTKAIRRMVDELCGLLREDALALVDAWDIPKDLLGAAIVE